jgi:DNA-directed RNA polymerase subunit RPC12/RpoP
MGRWVIETKGWQQVLTHYCDQMHFHDKGDALRQDIGGGYVRCERCGEKFLPAETPGNPRLLFRARENGRAPSGSY